MLALMIDWSEIQSICFLKSDETDQQYVATTGTTGLTIANLTSSQKTQLRNGKYLHCRPGVVVIRSPARQRFVKSLSSSRLDLYQSRCT